MGQAGPSVSVLGFELQPRDAAMMFLTQRCCLDYLLSFPRSFWSVCDMSKRTYVAGLLQGSNTDLD